MNKIKNVQYSDFLRSCSEIPNYSNLHLCKSGSINSFFKNIKKQREEFLLEQFLKYPLAGLMLSDWSEDALEKIRIIHPNYKMGTLTNIDSQTFFSLGESLDEGGWAIFFYNKPFESQKYPKDWFSCLELNDFCVANQIKVGISSFYDNFEWLVFTDHLE